MSFIPYLSSFSRPCATFTHLILMGRPPTGHLNPNRQVFDPLIQIYLFFSLSSLPLSPLFLFLTLCLQKISQEPAQSFNRGNGLRPLQIALHRGGGRQHDARRGTSTILSGVAVDIEPLDSVGLLCNFARCRKTFVVTWNPDCGSCVVHLPCQHAVRPAQVGRCKKRDGCDKPFQVGHLGADEVCES
jgi:hypothetical protein